MEILILVTNLWSVNLYNPFNDLKTKINYLADIWQWIYCWFELHCSFEKTSLSPTICEFSDLKFQFSIPLKLGLKPQLISIYYMTLMINFISLCINQCSYFYLRVHCCNEANHFDCFIWSWSWLVFLHKVSDFTLSNILLNTQTCK